MVKLKKKNTKKHIKPAIASDMTLYGQIQRAIKKKALSSLQSLSLLWLWTLICYSSNKLCLWLLAFTKKVKEGQI